MNVILYTTELVNHVPSCTTRPPATSMIDFDKNFVMVNMPDFRVHRFNALVLHTSSPVIDGLDDGIGLNSLSHTE